MSATAGHAGPSATVPHRHPTPYNGRNGALLSITLLLSDDGVNINGHQVLVYCA
jgi:hypothetical protein